MSILSTGTWVVAMAPGRPLDGLNENSYMLANINAFGDPVSLMRYMGGRKFSALAGPQPLTCLRSDILQIIDQWTLALPCFAESGSRLLGRSTASSCRPSKLTDNAKRQRFYIVR